MRFIERYNWLHVFVISVLLSLLVAAVVHFMLPGKFTAQSSLLLNDRPDVLAGVSDTPGAAPQTGPSLARLQAVLASRTMRERIIQKLSLGETLKANEGDTHEALTRMSSIKAIGEDGISVEVTVGGYFAPHIPNFGHPIPISDARDLSARIANLYISELTAYLRETDLASAQESREFLETRRSELAKELASARDRLQTLRADFELLDPTAEATRLGERLRTLEQSHAEAAAEADAAGSSLGVAEQQLDSVSARRIASEVETRNPLIASLQEQLVQLQTERAAELARGKTAEHRDVVQITTAIENVEQELRDLEETVISQVGDQPNPLHDDAVQRVVELRVQLAGARARQSEIGSLLGSARGEMAEMPAVAREYVEIDQSQQMLAERLTAVERALWAAEYEEARVDVGDSFRVLDEATLPFERKGPPTLVAGLIAFGTLLLLQGLMLIDRRWFGG